VTGCAVRAAFAPLVVGLHDPDAVTHRSICVGALGWAGSTHHVFVFFSESSSGAASSL
jgi:hypothetical protein